MKTNSAGESIAFWTGWVITYPIRILIGFFFLVIIEATIPSMWSKKDIA